ncbi:MAG: hypothetical protein ACXQTG_02760 [Methanoculleaceae archaeon]
MKCPYCGSEGGGRYCRNCGRPLEPHDPQDDGAITPEYASWSDICPACRSAPLNRTLKRGFLGLSSREEYSCPACGAVFTASGRNLFKFTRISDISNPVWKEYGSKVLRDRDWKRIAQGSLPGEKQREIDIKNMLAQVRRGDIPWVCTDPSPVILKRGERAVLKIPDVKLKEPRKVRRTYGGGAGPSFRIARGVYLRAGTFGARSESHEEIKEIDSGTLTLTNRRLVFTGGRRTVTIRLNKIVAMEPVNDGITINREGKQRTEYYTGLDRYTLRFNVEGRSYTEPLSGALLAAIIEGLINTAE